MFIHASLFLPPNLCSWEVTHGKSAVFHGSFSAQNPTATDKTKNTRHLPGIFMTLTG